MKRKTTINHGNLLPVDAPRQKTFFCMFQAVLPWKQEPLLSETAPETDEFQMLPTRTQ